MTILQVNGFRSLGPLFGLPGFSIPLGVSIDYMHGVCLGVVKTLVGLWFDSSNSSKKWYCGHLVHQVDSRLLSIKPPSAITRVPRSINSHRKHWKGKFSVLAFNMFILQHCLLLCPLRDYVWCTAFIFFSNHNHANSSMCALFRFLSAAEYRSWLFFYSLPCMKGILSDELFNHYALLVGGIYLLCQESISPADLRKAEMLLAHFVEMFDVYYGMACQVLSIQHL